MRAVYHLDDYRSLPLPTFGALIRHLPPTSAVMSIGRDGPFWTLTDYLLDDLRQEIQALRGVDERKIKPHSQRPIPPKQVKPIDPAREKKKHAARERIRERERAIAAGEIT